MTASQFNIQKEIHTNQVNKILQSVKFNNFHKEAKTQTVEMGVKVIETIHALQSEVSEQLDGPGHKKAVYDHTENYQEKRAVVLNEKQPIHKMRIGMIGELNEIIDKTEKTNNDIITGLEFKRFDKTNSFKENEKLLVDLLKDMKAAILIDDKETKPAEEALKEEKIEDQIIEETKEEDKIPGENSGAGVQSENSSSSDEKPKEDSFLKKLFRDKK
jgi:hypothetical protein